VSPPRNVRFRRIAGSTRGSAPWASRRFSHPIAPAFEVQSDRIIAAGIDGEAVQLEPPLRFRSRPAALHVRIAPQHAGASPSANLPAGALDAIRQLVRFALSRPHPAGRS